MSNYIRVLPRDLFNEASLLKCYGALWIALDNLEGAKAGFDEEDVNAFEIGQDPNSGALTVANLTFYVRGERYYLMRPLNSRNPWPLWLEGDDDSDFDPIAVFDDAGNLSVEMLDLVS